MSNATMTEKGKYLETLEREYQTTMRLLRLYPADRLDLQPSERSATAAQTIWTLAVGQMVIARIAEVDELAPAGFPEPVTTYAELVAALEAAHREAMAKVEAMADARMNAMLDMPVGPGKKAPVRRGDAMWMFLYDGIHHRGQLTVYQRMAGGKVPSIYGPSGDEPWF